MLIKLLIILKIDVDQLLLAPKIDVDQAVVSPKKVDFNPAVCYP
jgi:hypothetical protein